MTQGAGWELAVAVPVKNNKFTFGQYNTVKLTDPLTTNSTYAVYSRTLEDGAQLHNKVQRGDLALLGPSNHTDYKRERETVVVEGIERWQSTKGKIHFRDMNNKNAYSVNDVITIYGKGLAGGWSMDSLADYVFAEGIQWGPISKNLIQAFNEAETTPLAINAYSFDTNTKLLTLQLNTNKGFIHHLTNAYDFLKVPLNTDNQTIFKVLDSFTSGPTLYGLYGAHHDGGFRKPNAQRIRVKFGSSLPSGRLLHQKLLDYGSESYKSRSLIIPYQYYRLGGRAKVSESGMDISYGTDYTINMTLYGNGSNVSADDYIKANILSAANQTEQWIDFSTTGLLKTGISNLTAPEVVLYLNNFYAGDAYLGDLIVYLDELYIEHPGGVNYSNVDGCLSFERYNIWPIEKSIQISYTTDNITGQKLHNVKCRFEDVSQEFYDQLTILLEWQERGYYLNIHPNINDVSNVLTGKIKITDISKDFWHLGYRSFNFEFQEEL